MIDPLELNNKNNNLFVLKSEMPLFDLVPLVFDDIGIIADKLPFIEDLKIITKLPKLMGNESINLVVLPTVNTDVNTMHNAEMLE